MTATPWAATRDASVWDRPDVRTAKRVHVGRTDHPREPGLPVARCRLVLLDENATWDPADVPEHARCRRNGCRQAWPEAVAR